MSAHASFPGLAFGGQQARVFRSIHEATDEAFRLIPALVDFQFDTRGDLYVGTSFASVNGLALASMASPASRIHVSRRPEAAIVFPMAGRARFCVDRVSLDIQSHRSALFIPTSWPTDITGEERSVVVGRIDPVRLRRTTQTMLGLDSGDALLADERDPSEVALHFNKVSFDAVFRSLFAQIDHYAGHPELLSRSGIDDVLYRTLAMAMHPQAFARQAFMPAQAVNGKQLGRVCDWVMASLDGKIALTDLEKLSHMSRRTLHNAFMRAFGISPMAWVREQRLLMARSRLQGPYARSVTEVLYSCGFSNASLFTSQYAQRFGELPSVTLRRGG